MVSCLLLIFFWSKTSWIFRANRSVALLSLSFFLSLLDCTSMVTFADYMTRFRREFTSAVFLNESLMTILPSLLAIVQGNGRIQCIPAPNNNSSIAISTNQLDFLFPSISCVYFSYWRCRSLHSLFYNGQTSLRLAFSTSRTKWLSSMSHKDTHWLDDLIFYSQLDVSIQVQFYLVYYFPFRLTFWCHMDIKCSIWAPFSLHGCSPSIGFLASSNHVLLNAIDYI